jgi:hypothetical protein
MQPNNVKVYKLQNKATKHQKSEDSNLLEMCSLVAQKYTQYTFEELVNDVPLREVIIMYNSIQKYRAESLLYLNMIINGPNEKGKSKSNYKKTIKALSEIVER